MTFRIALVTFALVTLIAVGPASGRPEPDAGAQTPTLQILSPQPGDTLAAPFKVRYRVVGFAVGNPPLGHMNLYLGRVGASFKMVLPLTRQSGEVLVRDHPMLSGKRNLTFVLARADQTLLKAPTARVTVPGVVIEGSRRA
jgi:hypothetical protein